jgi:membrane protease YdiL (CAAX protease family)
MGRPRWGLWMAPAAIVLGLGLGQILVIVVNVIGQAAGGSTLHHPSPAVSLISDGLADLAFVAAALYFVSRAARLRAADFGFVRTPLGRAAAFVAAAGVSYYLVTLVYANVFSLHAKDKLPSELNVNHSTAALVGAAVFVCVVAPIAEEFFFRGFLLRVLSGIRLTVAGHDGGPWLAAVIVGVLFGAAHLGSASPEYLIPLGFLGFVLCLLRIRTGSLYPGMALHSLNNSLALGVNSLHWSGGAILALIAGSFAVIAGLVGPLSAGRGSTPAPE